MRLIGEFRERNPHILFIDVDSMELQDVLVFDAGPQAMEEIASMVRGLDGAVSVGPKKYVVITSDPKIVMVLTVLQNSLAGGEQQRRVREIYDRRHNAKHLSMVQLGDRISRAADQESMVGQTELTALGIPEERNAGQVRIALTIFAGGIPIDNWTDPVVPEARGVGFPINRFSVPSNVVELLLLHATGGIRVGHGRDYKIATIYSKGSVNDAIVNMIDLTEEEISRLDLPSAGRRASAKPFGGMQLSSSPSLSANTTGVPAGPTANGIR